MEKKIDERGLSGLNNLGNTCYMNSVIQCLSNTKWLRNFLLDEYKNYKKDNCIQFNMLEQLKNLIEELWNQNGVVSPTHFFTHLQILSLKLGGGQFVGLNQNDGSELLIFILDLLHESLATIPVSLEPNYFSFSPALKQWNLIFKNGESPIVQNFYNQLEIKIKCEQCNNIRYNYDPNSILHLPIPDCSSEITLDSCFEKFISEEELDTYKCDNCNQSVIAKRTDHIYKTSNHLIISLKRFNKNGTKNNSNINFPLSNLNLSRYMSEPTEKRYQLYGIVNHIGGTNCGHYFSYIEKGGNWYEFNDSFVRNIPVESIISSSAYILFYHLS